MLSNELSMMRSVESDLLPGRRKLRDEELGLARVGLRYGMEVYCMDFCSDDLLSHSYFSLQ